MSARTTPTLLDRIREAALLDAGRLEELARLPEVRDAKALARAILQRGWLTRHQLAAVARGEAASLHVGPYLITEPIGEGGMGQVFRATHKHMARTVALKLIRPERLRNPHAIARFYREAQAAARLAHPNLVTAFDAGPTGQTHYFAMELVEGIDLARLVTQNGPLPVESACDHVRQAALGLQHAHEQGLVHRDVKPHNLLVTQDGTVKLLDLGLARLDGDPNPGVTRLDQVLGTPDYLAPEQAVNARAADIRSDIYSLGCTLYHLLVGQPPFRAATLSQVLLAHQFDAPAPLHSRRPDVPASLSAVVECMMAKKPEDRYQVPQEVAEALCPFCVPPPPTRKAATPPPLPLGPLPSPEDEDRAEALTPTLAGTSQPSSFRLTRADALPEKGRRSARSGKMLAFLAAGGTFLLLALLTGLFLILLGRPRPAPEIAEGGDQDGEASPAPTAPPRPPAPRVPGPDEGSDTPEPPPKVQAIPQARQAFLLQGHAGPIRCTAVSPDSRLAASGSADKTVRLWDLDTGQEVHAFTDLPAPPDELAFSPDGTRLAVTCADTVRVWNVADKQVVPDAGKTGSYLAPFGQLVLAPKGEGGNLMLSVREVRAERKYGNLKLGAARARAVRFTPDARLAAVLDEAGVVWVFDLQERRETAKVDLSAEKPTALALAPDGSHLLLGTEAGMKVWDLASSRQVPVYEEKDPGPVSFLAFSADGGRALVDRRDGTVRLWDHGRGTALLQMAGHTGAITSAVFTADGRRAVTGSEDRTVRVWELGDQGPAAFTPAPLPPLIPEVIAIKPLRELKGSTSGVVDLDISPTGRYVAAVDGNDTVRVWVLRSGSLTRIEERLGATPRQVSFGGRGLYLRVFTGEEVQQWNLQVPGQPKAKAPLVADWMSHPAEHLFKVVATGTGGEISLAVFDLRTGRLRRRLPMPDETDLRFGYSPDGSYVGVVGLKGIVQVIDLRKVREVSRIEAGMLRDRPEALCLDAEGKRLFVGTTDGSIRVFDVKEKSEVALFKGKHEGPVHSLACTRDGRWLLSGGEDKSVRLWDVATGYERLRCEGHTLPVRHVRIDPEDRYAVTGGGDDLIHVWDLSAREKEE